MTLIIWVVVTEAVLLAGGFFAGDMCGIFCSMKHPPLSLIMKHYALVYILLSVFCGIAASRIHQLPPCEERTDALYKYYLQLAVSFFWPILMFRLNLYAFSAIWAVVLILLVLLTIKGFWDFDRKSGHMMIPYLIWILYGLYMNIGLWILAR